MTSKAISKKVNEEFKKALGKNISSKMENIDLWTGEASKKPKINKTKKNRRKHKNSQNTKESSKNSAYLVSGGVCRKCGSNAKWHKGDNGKWLLLNESGRNHFDECHSLRINPKASKIIGHTYGDSSEYYSGNEPPWN